MRNKINETAILNSVHAINDVANGMANTTLAGEIKKRMAAFEAFILNPGVPFEAANVSGGWTFPDPSGDDTRFSPVLATSGYGPVFATSAPIKKMEMNFNWLIANHGESQAFNYMVNAQPIATFSNYFRIAYDNSGTASAQIVNDYVAGGGGSKVVRSQVSDDGGTFWYGAQEIKLPYPTGTIAAPTPRI